MTKAGAHFPWSEVEFRSWLRDDNVDLDYLDWLRNNGQRICAKCGAISPPRVVTGQSALTKSCTST